MYFILFSFIYIFSKVLCTDLNHHGVHASHELHHPHPYASSGVVEVVYWRQPICVVNTGRLPPCSLKLEKHKSEYGQLKVNDRFLEPEARNFHARKSFITNRVRRTVMVDELNLTSIDQQSDEIYDKSVETTTDNRRKRHYPGKTLYSKELVYVPKVLNSPVVANLVLGNCFPNIGIPLCDNQNPEQIDNHQTHPIIGDLQHAINETLKNKTTVITQFIQDILNKKESFVNSVVKLVNETTGKLKNKTQGILSVGTQSPGESVCNQNLLPLKPIHQDNVQIHIISNQPQAIASNIKLPVTQHILHKKAHIVDKKNDLLRIISNLLDKKKKFIQELIDKKKEVIQKVIDKKIKFERAHPDVAAKHKNIIQNIIESKKKTINSIIEKTILFGNTIVNNVMDIRKLKSAAQEFLEKKDNVKNVTKTDSVEEYPIKKINDKKDKVVKIVSSIIMKADTVKGNIIDKINDKKDKVDKVVANVVAIKNQAVQGIIDKKQDVVQGIINKKDILQDIVEKKQNIVQDVINKKSSVIASAADIKHQVIEDISQKKSDIIQTVVNKKDSIIETVSVVKDKIFEGIIDKKNQVIEGITDKKDNVVEGIINKKDDIVEAIAHAAVVKGQIVEGVVDKKDSIIQGIIDKKDQVIQGIIGKKDSFAETLAHAAVLKGQIVEGMIINKKNDVIQGIIDKKDSIVKAVPNSAAVNDQIVKGMINTKENIVQSVVDKKENVVDAIASVADKKDNVIQEVKNEKQNIIQGIIDKTENIIQNLVTKVVNKKNDIMESIFDKTQKTGRVLNESEKSNDENLQSENNKSIEENNSSASDNSSSITSESVAKSNSELKRSKVLNIWKEPDNSTTKIIEGGALKGSINNVSTIAAESIVEELPQLPVTDEISDEFGLRLDDSGSGSRDDDSIKTDDSLPTDAPGDQVAVTTDANQESSLK